MEVRMFKFVSYYQFVVLLNGTVSYWWASLIFYPPFVRTHNASQNSTFRLVLLILSQFILQQLSIIFNTKRGYYDDNQDEPFWLLVPLATTVGP